MSSGRKWSTLISSSAAPTIYMPILIFPTNVIFEISFPWYSRWMRDIEKYSRSRHWTILCRSILWRFKLIFVCGSPFQLFRSFSGASREYIAFHMNVELEKPARSLKPRIEHRDYFFRMSNTTIRSPHSVSYLLTRVCTFRWTPQLRSVWCANEFPH